MLDLAVRLVLSLGVVLLVIWGIARLSARRFGTSTNLVRVVGRQGVSRGASVAVVRVADRYLVLGVTDHEVTYLSELEGGSIAELDHEPAAADTAAEQTAQQAGPAASPAAGGAHRAAHRAAPTASVDGAPFAGSLLSVGTWRAAWSAMTGARGTA